VTDQEGDTGEPVSPHLSINPYHLFADLDRSGAWWRMTQPGTSGHGLMVTTVSPTFLDGGYAVHEMIDTDIPVLLPAPVIWESMYTPDGLWPEFHDKYGDDLVPPMIAITDIETIDDQHSQQFTNLATQSDEWPMDGELSYVEGFGPLWGLAPIWTVVPISEDTYRRIKRTIRVHTNDTDAYLVGWGYYDFENWEYEYLDMIAHSEGVETSLDMAHRLMDGAHTAMRYATGEPLAKIEALPCTYKVEDAVCSCGRVPTSVQRATAIWDQPRNNILCGHCYFEPQLVPLWQHAVTGYTNGWERVHTIMQGDQWFYSLWQQFSPWLRSPSHALPDLLGCHALQSSETQLAFSLEPSTSSTASDGSSSGSTLDAWARVH
jgi:hypothetical protein